MGITDVSDRCGRSVLFGKYGCDDRAVDLLELAPSCHSQCVGGDAVDVAEYATGTLVEHAERVGCEDLTIRARRAEPVRYVLDGVFRRRVVDGDAAVDAGPERAVLVQLGISLIAIARFGMTIAGFGASRSPVGRKGRSEATLGWFLSPCWIFPFGGKGPSSGACGSGGGCGRRWRPREWGRRCTRATPLAGAVRR